MSGQVRPSVVDFCERLARFNFFVGSFRADVRKLLRIGCRVSHEVLAGFDPKRPRVRFNYRAKHSFEFFRRGRVARILHGGDGRV